MKPCLPHKLAANICICSRSKMHHETDTHRETARLNKGLDTAHLSRVRPPHMVWNATDPSQAPNKNLDHWSKWTLYVLQYCRVHIFFWCSCRAFFDCNHPDVSTTSKIFKNFKLWIALSGSWLRLYPFQADTMFRLKILEKSLCDMSHTTLPALLLELMSTFHTSDQWAHSRYI